MKLKKKERIGSKVKKIHEKPVLPYDRIVESIIISQDKKDKLKEIHDDLDLYDLKRKITNCQRKLKSIQKEKRTNFNLFLSGINFEAMNRIKKLDATGSCI